MNRRALLNICLPDMHLIVWFFVSSTPFARTCNAATWIHVCQDGQ